MKSVFLFLLPACALAACGDAEGTSVSIDAGGKGDEAVKIEADGKSGAVAVKVPGLSANVQLPKIMLDAGNFDVDGVRLFPDSKVRSLNIVADEAAGGGPANVEVQFDAPADPAAVRDWFLKAFADKAVEAVAAGTGIRGVTRDGEAFTIDLAPGGTAATKGTLRING